LLAANVAYVLEGADIASGNTREALETTGGAGEGPVVRVSTAS
jgi:hypothetical protein